MNKSRVYECRESAQKNFVFMYLCSSHLSGNHNTLMCITTFGLSLSISFLLSSTQLIRQPDVGRVWERETKGVDSMKWFKGYSVMLVQKSYFYLLTHVQIKRQRYCHIAVFSNCGISIEPLAVFGDTKVVQKWVRNKSNFLHCSSNYSLVDRAMEREKLGGVRSS